MRSGAARRVDTRPTCQRHKGGVSFSYWTSNPWFSNAPRELGEAIRDQEVTQAVGATATTTSSTASSKKPEVVGLSAVALASLRKGFRFDDDRDDPYYDDVSTHCDSDYAESAPEEADDYQHLVGDTPANDTTTTNDTT